MKLSKDELIAKINEKVMDEDVKIELMEDITDSVETEGSTNEEDKQRIEELETKYKDLQEKYKERFLNSNTKEDKEDKEEMIDNEEEKTIDIKEI
jgi:hypothetical protein|nr:MAG TPA: hypothetical protein [Bacteriophage sp.]